jgi:hypothetical protein
MEALTLSATLDTKSNFTQRIAHEDCVENNFRNLEVLWLNVRMTAMLVLSGGTRLEM